jgi:hypothetical protein
MKYKTSIPHRRNTKTFVASLLTYVMLTGQLAPLALGFNRSANRNLATKNSVTIDSSSQPTDGSTSGKRNNDFAPVPKPLTVSPAAVAPIISATKTDSFADSDMDGKAEPGEIITYSITVTNTGPDAATNLTLNDTVDANTALVGGSVRSTPIGFNDAFNVLGNVRIQVPDGASDLLANDIDPETGNNTGLTITTLAGDASAPFAGTSVNGGQVTATAGDGSFQYNPAPGFTGTDTFSYTTTDSSGGGTSTATVTLTVTGVIWFVNSAADPGGDGRLTTPFNCLVGAGCFDPVAADDAGDNIFLYSGSYTGGLTLLNNQKLIGAGASQALDMIAGVTVPSFSDALPPTGQAFPSVTTAVAATNAINISAGGSNTLRGFNIGNTTGAKIASALSPPAAAFGTLTISEMALSGNGQALNLDNGTVNATFTSISSNLSAGQGINLDQIAGTLVSTGGTTVTDPATQCILVTGSTANITFNNTSCTLATDGISLQNNSAGTRTFGTISVTGATGVGFLHSTGGGAVTVTGATTITNPGGVGIDVDGSNANLSFAATTVSKNSTGIGVDLTNNATRTIGFTSLAVTTTNSFALNTNNSGTVNVGGGSLTQLGAGGGAASLTNTALGLTFTSVSSDGGSNGIIFSGGSGTFSSGTTNLQNNAGIGLLMSSSAVAANFGNTTVNSSAGDGVDLSSNTGAITFADLDISPDAGLRGLDAQNNTGAITSTSGTIVTTGIGVAVFIDGPAGLTPLNMVLTSISSNGQSAVNLTEVSGTAFTSPTTTALNSAGTGISVASSTTTNINFGNANANSSAGTGVFLNASSSAITFIDLDIAPDSGQRAFHATNNTGTLTVATGDITTLGAGNRAVDIDGPAGRTPINIQFTTITTAGAANGISLVDVSGTKFQVTGTTQVNTRAGTGVFVDNSTATSIQFATVNVPNPSAAGGYGIRVEDSSSAVTVATATISDSNQTVAQTDAGGGIPGSNGDGDAIFLTNNTGTFTLNGGTLSNCGNDCIDLHDSTGLVLSAVNISAPGQDVTGATGAGAGGHGISLFNLRGTASITGGTISGFNAPSRDGIYLLNNTSTALALTVQGTTFQNAIGNRGFGIRGDAAANMTVTVGGPTNNVSTNCIFSNISGPGLQSIAGGTVGSTATVNLTVQNSTFQNSPTDGKTNLIAGVVEAGKSTLVIQNNTFSNVFITASTGEALININNDGLLAGNQLALNLTGNNINGVGSAAATCAGGAVNCLGPLNAILVFIDDQANVPGTLNIDNNTITNVRQGGILLDMANAGAAASNVAAKITNNCIGRLRVAGACTGADARVGLGAGLANGRGIAVERRRLGAKTANVLVSGNSIRNGAGQNAGNLNTPGIFGRTQADTTMSITVLNNSVDTNFVGAPEIRLDANSPTPGDPITQVMCSDINGNSFPAGAGLIDINELDGTHNVEQASAAAVAAANGAATVTADAGVTFGIVCATPPAAVDPGDIDNLLTATAEQVTAARGPAEQTAAPQVVVPGDGITSRPFVSSPRTESTKDATSIAEWLVTSGVGAKSDIIRSKSETKSAVKPTSDLVNPTPPVVVGNNVNWNLGTLPAGQSVTITFQVQVENPYDGPAQVSNQGTITADGGINVLTDDPSIAGVNNPTVTPIDVPVDVSIKDATVAEPPSSTTSMLFTVTLSAPATGPVSVNYATADGGATPATGGTCGGGGADYATTNGTVNFVSGQQVQTIAIQVCSDGTVEPDETFLVNLSTPTNGIIVDGQATGTITAANTPGTTLISELRTSGPGGTNDDFVEIYNNTNSPLTVAASDASAGYGLYKAGATSGDTPVLIGTIPNGTIIPARGHYLFVGSAYSLANYGGTGAAAGNLTMTADIENDRNVGLFNTSNVANISSTTRLDAVGFGPSTGGNFDLLREGTNLATANGSTSEYSFVRKLATGTPQDTNDNVADFVVVTTTPATPVGTNATPGLGAPGPENQTSPLQRNATIKASLVDTGVASTASPNRVRDTTPDIPNNSTFGTLDIRRKFTNNTGGPVTRLRFRIVDVTTFPQPGGTADLRARTSGNVTVTITGGSMVSVIGTTLEVPPAQPNGGGQNSTMSAGTVTLGTPIANGASINVHFLLGVQQNGGFRFFINVEALP